MNIKNQFQVKLNDYDSLDIFSSFSFDDSNTDKFLQMIESHNMYFGGSIGDTGIEGCLDHSESSLSESEIEKLLNDFVNNN